MTIPRLTRFGRRSNSHMTAYRRTYPGIITPARASRPSPREAHAARLLAYRRAMRKHADQTWRLIGRDINRDSWPESRGTTSGQLIAMHLEAES